MSHKNDDIRVQKYQQKNDSKACENLETGYEIKKPKLLTRKYGETRAAP